MPTLAGPLEHALRDRESTCFGTPAFKVIKFLDPRLKHTLTLQEQDEAIKLIIAMENRLSGKNENELSALDAGAGIYN